MSKEDETRRKNLVDAVLGASTLDQIKEVFSSREYKEASGLEVALTNSVLGFRVVELRLIRVEELLAELEKAVEQIGGKK